MNQRRADFQAIGTNWLLQINEPVGDTAWIPLFARIKSRIEAFDGTYSRFRADSLVGRMAAKAGTYKLPQDGFKMLQFYEQLYSVTDGKITPLIGQTIADAGYDASYSFKTGELHRPPRWEDVLRYDPHEITVRKPVLLDFGAAGKGYLVDIIGELVEAAGIRNFMLNAGGDILHRAPASQSIDVGLENPLDTSEAVGIVRLANKSLCASAGNKRTWGRFNHIIDPDLLRSPDTVRAVWVLAEDTMTADGLATALFFTDPQTIRSNYSFSYARLYKDMSMQYAKDFPVTVFKEAREAN